MTRRYVTTDSRGVNRTGPSGAWWANLTPRPQRAGFGLEVPSGRAAGWNVAAVAYLAAGVCLAARLGDVMVFLAVIGGLLAVTGIALMVITRRCGAGGQPYPDSVAAQRVSVTVEDVPRPPVAARPVTARPVTVTVEVVPEPKALPGREAAA